MKTKTTRTTYSPRPGHIERRWYVVDAGGEVLGRLASEVAALLRGKHKPIFAPHMDTGDHVIVVNAERVKLTGGKQDKKVAYRHSGYPGGIRGTGYARLLAERPAYVIEKAVKGMLPKNRLGRAMFKKLHVVAGAEHPHAAQKPVAYSFGRPPAWEGLPGTNAREPAPEAAAKTTEPAAGSTTARPPKPKPAASRKASATKRSTASAGASAKTAATKTGAKSTARSKAPKASEGASEKPTRRKTTARKTATKKTTTTRKTTARKTTKGSS
jgi:large subunit ribosomal protein L13